jgi:hypothetical protein
MVYKHIDVHTRAAYDSLMAQMRVANEREQFNDLAMFRRLNSITCTTI